MRSVIEAPRRRLGAALALGLAVLAGCSSPQPVVVGRAPTSSPLPQPSPSAPPPAARPGEPDLFGSTAVRIGRTPADAKWAAIPALTAEDLPPLWAAAREDLARRSGLDRLAAASAWVNRHVAQATDRALYGQGDHWASLQETARLGRGDCEDYAIAKMQLLEAAGFPGKDLYLVVVYDALLRQEHAVLAASLDGRFFILDSQTDRVLPAEQVRDYRPILTYSLDRSWIHGFRNMPADVRLASTISPGGQ